MLESLLAGSDRSKATPVDPRKHDFDFVYALPFIFVYFM
jgi:hypothetical protein